MRVLVDGRIGGADGIGRYTTSVTGGLTGTRHRGVELTVLRAGTARRYSRADGVELLNRAAESRADLLHTLDYRVPITVSPEIPTIVTVHDVLRTVDPALCYSDAAFADRFGVEGLTALREAVDALRDIAPFPARRVPRGTHDEFLGRMLALAVSRADRVITPTAVVARQLGDLVPARDKLCVSPWGVDHLPAPADEVPPGVAGRFVLFVGQARPHKGLAALLAAVSRTALFGAGAPLVLVGRDWVPSGVAAVSAVGALGAHRLVLLGNVSDAELALLYTRASVLLHLADHEGFGFPPLEALRHGCPVVAADIPVLRETLGGQAEFVSPRDADAVARRVDEVVATDEPSARTARIRWARRFDWQRHIGDLLMCYRQAGHG
ncbi:MAG: glycosyltransferase family 4 protein [Pseudonocardiaceae bacterium]